MRTKPLIALLVGLGVGWVVAAPARADDGPSMSVTEQYIMDNFNKYFSPNMNHDQQSVTAAECKITINQKFSNQSDGDTEIISMNEVKGAQEQDSSDEIKIVINEWPPLHDIATTYWNETNNWPATSFGTLDLSPTAFGPAQRLIKAIDHYAALCGSTDPAAITPAPNDPFSN